MAGAAAVSGQKVGTCPGCGYPVMGAHACAICAPLLIAATGDTGPTVAA